MSHTKLYNKDLIFWQNTAKAYRDRPDGGPTLRVLEGNLWSIPGHFVSARFESSEEGERVLLAAGFKFTPAERGFRASDRVS